jgi:LAO/AO transport system kinase
MSRIDHYEDHHKQLHDSALTVNHGIGQPPVVNPGFRRAPRRVLSVGQIIEGILARDVTILSQAITMVESHNPAHGAMAQQIVEGCLPHSGRSVRIGITGVPGAGKSTFIEAVGGLVTSRGHRLAVLAIDPSSQRSGGSILGDKTRMESLTANPDAFIRPSPSAGSLGGVARKTRETIILCEAAGYDVVFVETVGVGQSETAVHSMVDIFMLLQIAGAGDELQGIKRGIMEMADLIAITKADGENVHRAGLAKAQITSALSLFPIPGSGRRPEVFTCSSVSGEGLAGVWGGVEDFLDFTRGNGFFETHRREQNKYWMYGSIEERLRTDFYSSPRVQPVLADYEQRVREGRISSFTAAGELLERYFSASRHTEIK